MLVAADALEDARFRDNLCRAIGVC